MRQTTAIDAQKELRIKMKDTLECKLKPLVAITNDCQGGSLHRGEGNKSIEYTPLEFIVHALAAACLALNSRVSTR